MPSALRGTQTKNIIYLPLILTFIKTSNLNAVHNKYGYAGFSERFVWWGSVYSCTDEKLTPTKKPEPDASLHVACSVPPFPASPSRISRSFFFYLVFGWKFYSQIPLTLPFGGGRDQIPQIDLPLIAFVALLPISRRFQRLPRLLLLRFLGFQLNRASRWSSERSIRGGSSLIWRFFFVWDFFSYIFFSRSDPMGFVSRKLFPSCGSMCVCCPALRPSSRRPVKRYKKLLAEIFPKTLVKIAPLCSFR